MTRVTATVARESQRRSNRWDVNVARESFTGGIIAKLVFIILSENDEHQFYLWRWRHPRAASKKFYQRYTTSLVRVLVLRSAPPRTKWPHASPVVLGCSYQAFEQQRPGLCRLHPPPGVRRGRRRYLSSEKLGLFASYGFAHFYVVLGATACDP